MSFPLDLVVLLPGKDDERTLRTLLEQRTADLRIRQVKYETALEIGRDPGCLRRAQDTLRPFLRQAAHALVMFDHEGCGREQRNAAELEEAVRARLEANGWAGRADVVVVDPELEQWLWVDPALIGQTFGSTGLSALQGKLHKEGLWRAATTGVNGEPLTFETKPHRPKEALEVVLKEANTPRSSALYSRLAAIAPLATCSDRAFGRLTTILRTWFPT